MLWDESADSLILVGNVGIGLTSPQTLVHIHDSGTGGSDLLRLTTGDTGSGSSDGFKVHYESDLDICYMNLEQGDHKWYTHNGSSVSDRMILSDAGNLSLTGDFSLKHDGAVLYFGADNDVSLTHIADNGLRLPDSRAMYFGDDTDLQIYHTGSAGFINNATGDLTVDVAGDIILDADGGDIIFKDGGTTIGTFANNSNNLRIVSNVSDADLILRGVDGGAAINALTLDMSEGGAGLFVAGIGVLGGSVAANIGVNVLTKSILLGLIRVLVEALPLMLEALEVLFILVVVLMFSTAMLKQILMVMLNLVMTVQYFILVMMMMYI